MKVNENVAIGLFKNEMINIMLEEESEKRVALYDKLIDEISKYRVTIRKNRKFKQKISTNKNSFKKLRSYWIIFEFNSFKINNELLNILLCWKIYYQTKTFNILVVSYA